MTERMGSGVCVLERMVGMAQRSRAKTEKRIKVFVRDDFFRIVAPFFLILVGIAEGFNNFFYGLAQLRALGVPVFLCHFLARPKKWPRKTPRRSLLELPFRAALQGGLGRKI